MIYFVDEKDLDKELERIKVYSPELQGIIAMSLARLLKESLPAQGENDEGK